MDKQSLNVFMRLAPLLYLPSIPAFISDRRMVMVFAGDFQEMCHSWGLAAADKRAMASPLAKHVSSVTDRKDDAPVAIQAASASVVDLDSFSGGGWLIQAASG